MQDCIFCKIIAGEIPSKNIWEDENYVAFLDIQPTARGMTLVVPKKHINSNIMELDNKVIGETMDAVKKVAKILDEKLEEFENIIINFSKKDHERHGYYLRKQLWSFLMSVLLS